MAIPLETQPIYEPTFDISESMSQELGTIKIGQKFRAIIEYEVIEKTKTYTVLRIRGFFLVNTKRQF